MQANVHKGSDYLKVQFPNLDSSRTISALARTSLDLKNISMNLGLENSTFQQLGK